jgi:hypothetical protein
MGIIGKKVAKRGRVVWGRCRSEERRYRGVRVGTFVEVCVWLQSGASKLIAVDDLK